MNISDLRNKTILIASDWEYDNDFVRILESAVQDRGLNAIVVNPKNLDWMIQEIQSERQQISLLVDRASDTSPPFVRLQSLLHDRGVPVIDPIEQLRWVSDKATLHLEFLSAGIPTPYTIILPPYREKNTPALHVDNLALLGRPFVIKPANTTGGGIGVVNGAESLQDILQARKELQSDKYLIQEKILPMELEGYRFWFRSFFVGGQIFSLWWHDEDHLYSVIDDAQMERFELKQIPSLMERIAKIAGLIFFSSEVVHCVDGRWVVVDYVNESCDMRLQSKHPDGVPDVMVDRIARTLIDAVI